MRTSIAYVLWLLVITQGTSQAKVCRRTNLKPKKYCLQTTCQTDKECGKDEKCRCDGDCGMSCIKNAMLCKNPGDIKFGSKNKDKRYHRIGSKVIYWCFAGYEREGSREITCTKSGAWSSSPPKCKRSKPILCKNPGNIKFGSKNEDKKYHRIGSKVIYWCFAGYKREGRREITCTKSGAWSSSPPKCKHSKPILCKNPGDIKFGSKNEDKKYHRIGSKVIYWCFAGHKREGSREITCNKSGAWSSSPPKCKRPCPDPGIPKGGFRLEHSFLHNETVRFSCKKGWRLDGKEEIKCKDGDWTDKTPRCSDCDDALGMQNRNIPDKNIKASSWSQWRDARYARLRGNSAWCTGSLTRNPFLEINLRRPFKITSLATQGSSRDNIWETKYIVSHSLAKSSFLDYRENNREKIFDGNVDATTVVKHKLKQPFIAKRIRFYPFGWRLLGVRITRSCMRVEIYGCDLPKDCVMVGSPVLGEWMSRSSGGSVYHKSYVKTIDHKYNEVQLELDDKSMHDDEFKTLRKSSVVMDTPNKHFNLDIGTRVLFPSNGRFYTGKIERKTRNYYGVTLDGTNTFKWALMKEIRVLEKTKFCG